MDQNSFELLHASLQYSQIAVVYLLRGQLGLGRRQASVHVPQVLDVGEKLDDFRSVVFLFRFHFDHL